MYNPSENKHGHHQGMPAELIEENRKIFLELASILNSQNEQAQRIFQQYVLENESQLLFSSARELLENLKNKKNTNTSLGNNNQKNEVNHNLILDHVGNQIQIDKQNNHYDEDSFRNDTQKSDFLHDLKTKENNHNNQTQSRYDKNKSHRKGQQYRKLQWQLNKSQKSDKEGEVANNQFQNQQGDSIQIDNLHRKENGEVKNVSDDIIKDDTKEIDGIDQIQNNFNLIERDHDDGNHLDNTNQQQQLYEDESRKSEKEKKGNTIPLRNSKLNKRGKEHKWVLKHELDQQTTKKSEFKPIFQDQIDQTQPVEEKNVLCDQINQSSDNDHAPFSTKTDMEDLYRKFSEAISRSEQEVHDEVNQTDPQGQNDFHLVESLSRIDFDSFPINQILSEKKSDQILDSNTDTTLLFAFSGNSVDKNDQPLADLFSDPQLSSLPLSFEPLLIGRSFSEPAKLTQREESRMNNWFQYQPMSIYEEKFMDQTISEKIQTNIYGENEHFQNIKAKDTAFDLKLLTDQLTTSQETTNTTSLPSIPANQYPISATSELLNNKDAISKQRQTLLPGLVPEVPFIPFMMPTNPPIQFPPFNLSGQMMGHTNQDQLLMYYQQQMYVHPPIQYSPIFSPTVMVPSSIVPPYFNKDSRIAQNISENHEQFNHTSQFVQQGNLLNDTTTSVQQHFNNENETLEGFDIIPQVRSMSRIVQNQPGLLYISSQSNSNGQMVLHAQYQITVTWSLPKHVFDRPDSSLMVGIFWLGSKTNTSAIITKEVGDFDIQLNHQIGQVRGEIPFKTPRVAGVFTFRLFDQNSPIITLATSQFFFVMIRDVDLEHNLQFIFSTPGNSSSMLASLSKLQQIFSKGEFSEKRSIEKLWGMLVFAKKQIMKYNPTNEIKKTSISKHRVRIHARFYSLLKTFLNNKNIITQLNPQNLEEIGKWLRSYCPVNEQFFPTVEEMFEYCTTKFSFSPLFYPLEQINQQMLFSLSIAIQEKTQYLLPSVDFYPKREAVRIRLEYILLEINDIPDLSTLQIFGSTANMFGNDSSNLDMSLIFPQNVIIKKNHSELIDVIAKKLEQAGMENVQIRLSTRIPMVLFIHPETGLNCNISIQNILAVDNTFLLYTYSQIDYRVYALALIIKHWTKQRKINDDSQSKLSSYGYLLCLIHFLQNRSPPILPNLQNLAADWVGNIAVSNTKQSLPKRIRVHPSENRDVNTYFYFPPSNDFFFLRNFASQNQENLGILLTDFFRYFGTEFDYMQHIVSIRTGTIIDKSLKGELDCWDSLNTLSIEDPFETWYDVAHALKPQEFHQIRLEFMRAFTLICNASDSGNLDGKYLLEKICESSSYNQPIFDDNNNEEGKNGNDSEEEPYESVEEI